MNGQKIHIIIYQLVAIIFMVLTVELSFNEVEYFVETEEEYVEVTEEIADQADTDLDVEYGGGNNNFIQSKVYFLKSKLFLFLRKGIQDNATCFASAMIVGKAPKLYLLFQQLKLHL